MLLSAIPKSFLEKEAEHVEVLLNIAVVTHAPAVGAEETLIVRPF